MVRQNSSNVANGIHGLMFFIKFKGVDGSEFVPRTVANKSIPQMVIRFYEDPIENSQRCHTLCNKICRKSCRTDSGMPFYRYI